MSPSTARDPFDDGNAPWTGAHTEVGPDRSGEDTRPLPRPGTGSGAERATGPVPIGHDAARTAPLPSSEDAAVPTRGGAAPTGRTGVASGRLQPRSQRSGPADPVGDDHLTRSPDRISAEASWETMRPAVRSGQDGATAVARPSAEQVRARQRQRFGGMRILPGFMGLLVALALGALLLGLADLAGPGVGLDVSGGAGSTLDRAWSEPGAAQLWGGVVVLGLVELLSMLAGGYTAGRMARFSGVAQGVSVWLWSLLARAAASAAVLLWATGATPREGSRWVVQELVGANPGVGLVALAGLLVLGLLGAVLGGAWGMRYHRKVDAWTMSNAWE